VRECSVLPITHLTRRDIHGKTSALYPAHRANLPVRDLHHERPHEDRRLGPDRGLHDREGHADGTSVLAAAIVFEVVGGLSVLLGYRARLGALMLIVFLVPATMIFHNPAGLEGMARQVEMINMMKNFTIMGGLMMVLAFGGGPLSLDNRRAS
jgi:uncharacterized membrane protein YphA (DoxX/SURF4 family)